MQAFQSSFIVKEYWKSESSGFTQDSFKKSFHKPTTRISCPSLSQVSATAQKIIGNLVKPGQYVVHPDYGIGKFKGMRLEKDHMTYQLHKCAIIEFSDGLLSIPKESARILIPLNEGLHSSILKGKTTQINLGTMKKTTKWMKDVKEAKKSAKKMAFNLIALYSSRSKKKRSPYIKTAPDLNRFEQAFDYELTRDQKISIDQIYSDMCDSDKPMDRMICGDVGFGKTEVAMRAAMRAVVSGRQVLMLIPTTVLAAQHFRTFKERTKGLNVEVECLTRRTPACKRVDILKGCQDGTLNILIGTTSILAMGKQLKNLGLLIIDEEQRFGVNHKESIKALRESVDCLTMSATPIPRTLYMSMSGVRALSLIRTPPANRLPIITYLRPDEDNLLQSAINREMSRGGQVFYIAPRKSDLQMLKHRIEQMISGCRILTGHAHTPNLDDKMMDFADGKYDILISTTIIESGIDIPAVNTLLVHNADRFGLAQLYQLRGRVGRSDIQGYALFFYQSNKSIAEDAMKRLEAMETYSYLGAGFELAKTDLEQRGAGSIYGVDQSGIKSDVGFEFYMTLVQEAVKFASEIGELKTIEPRQIDLQFISRQNSFPFYVAKRGRETEEEISSTSTLEEFKKVRSEWEERGDIDMEDLNLKSYLRVHELRVTAGLLGIGCICRLKDGTLVALCKTDTTLLRRLLMNAQPASVRTFQDEWNHRCSMVDGQGITVRGLGARPVNSQVDSLVFLLRPLAEVVEAYRKRLDIDV